MLTEEQLVKILNKTKLTQDDAMLLEHHIFEIGRCDEEYGDSVPNDVLMAQSYDLERICDRLRQHLEEQLGEETTDRLIKKLDSK